MSSISCRYLEFNQVVVDLRHLIFSVNGLDDNEFIIFLNVHKGIFTNFKIYTDMSFESLAEYLFVEAKCSVANRLIKRSGTLGECVTFISADRNKSLNIALHEHARIILAKTIFFNEKYHKRVSGYIDYENRFNKNYVMPDEKKRAAIDREWELKLLESI